MTFSRLRQLKVGVKVRLIDHGTAPQFIGQIFTVSEAPREGRVMLEDDCRWLRADVGHVRILSGQMSITDYGVVVI